MPIEDAYGQRFASGGWICAACGQWVADGVVHYCGMQTPYYGGSPYPQPTVQIAQDIVPVLLQILDKLKTIQEDVEALRMRG